MYKHLQTPKNTKPTENMRDFTFATFSVANIPAYNHDTRVMIEEYSTAKYIVHW